MRIFEFTGTIVALILLVSCGNKEREPINPKEDGFILSGDITDHEDLYLKISYDNKIDSALVKEGKFRFEGKVNGSKTLTFLSKKAVASKRQLYLENSNIHVNLSLEKKIINPDLTIDWFSIDTSTGSETDLLFTEFTKFKNTNQTNFNWNQKLYTQLEDMFKKHPSSALSVDLLFDETLETTLTNTELRNLYSLIDWKNQDEFRKYQTAKTIMPEKYYEIGTKFKDITLLNDKGVEVSSMNFRGTYLLVDFWATWCVPCREEFPTLKSIYNQYEDKGFNLLAVSIDDEKKKWLQVVNEDKFKWSNVYSKEGLDDDIVEKFNLYSIPANYLLDKKGIIIAKDINPEELESFLKKNI